MQNNKHKTCRKHAENMQKTSAKYAQNATNMPYVQKICLLGLQTIMEKKICKICTKFGTSMHKKYA